MFTFKMYIYPESYDCVDILLLAFENNQTEFLSVEDFTHFAHFCQLI